MPENRKTIVIAGAAGYVGRALIKALAPEYKVIALSRRAFPDTPQVEWRSCDLFSPSDIERAVAGADYAIYLVHSMLPAELTQAHFADMDLLLADNFARIARQAGLKQIVYLGGLIPESNAKAPALSEHLASRFEVGQVLAAYGIPVTLLRAGIVIGAEGSSFRILLRLVKRLPFLFCPRVLRSLTHPIALAEVVQAIRGCVGREECLGRAFDLGGPQVMSYLEMMRLTARELGLRRPAIPVYFLAPALTSRCISLITGAHTELTAPLVESLRHEMVAKDQALQTMLNITPVSFTEALRTAIEGERRLQADDLVLRRHLSRAASPSREKESACSIQRMVLPPDMDALQIAREYGDWITYFLRSFVKVVSESDRSLSFYALGRHPLLFLKYSDDYSSSRRAVFLIRGGLLCRLSRNLDTTQGWFEIRLFPEQQCFIIGIFKFHPALPWWLYRLIQAPFHMFIMNSFGRHLRMLRERNIKKTR